MPEIQEIVPVLKKSVFKFAANSRADCIFLEYVKNV